MTPDAISLRPSEMVEGGAIPVDQNLTIKSARFELFNYNGTAPQTCAGKLELETDEGVEYIQYYSAGDPSRFVPSTDFKSLVSVGMATAINKSSNFAILMDNVVNAGFPENKLGGDISVLEGLHAYWIGIPAPKRTGLKRQEGQPERESVILCPSEIHTLPGEKKGGKASAKAGAKATLAAEPTTDITPRVVEFIQAIVAEEGSVTRQALAARVFKDLVNDPDRDRIAPAVFTPETSAALVAAGLTVDGDNIS